MKVVLLDNVRGIGQVGDVKEVSDGYARNFLLPRKLCKPVSDGVLKDVEGLKAKKLEALALEHAKSAELAAKLAGITVVMQGKANEKGKLFSGITESDIAHSLSTLAGAHIPPTAISLDGHIKTIGAHSARLELAGDVVADIAIDVQPLE